jgi:hypothetical protein
MDNKDPWLIAFRQQFFDRSSVNHFIFAVLKAMSGGKQAMPSELALEYVACCWHRELAEMVGTA